MRYILYRLFVLFAFTGSVYAKQGETEITLKSKDLSTVVDKSFPRIISYHLNDNKATIGGQSATLDRVLINDEVFVPKVTSEVSSNHIIYSLVIDEIDLSFKVQVKVDGNIVSLRFLEVSEQGSYKVNSIAFPEHHLISINSGEKGAVFSGSKMYTAIEGNGDEFQKLGKKTKIDSVAKGYLYAIVNNNHAAAAIWTNAVQEKSDNHRILKQTIRKGKLIETGVWSGSWIYRAKGMQAVDKLPELKIVITGDRNGDAKVDWQDGAIAYRSILNVPFGAERIPEMVVQRIPMNFSSQATNPFTKTLDETKRIFLNTDGLGQYVILKGYGSEGHDSKHPDYGDIGKRQGGAEEMNVLANEAEKYNASIGVHINGTESYPEAAAFNETLIDKNRRGWNWLDQSYYMDKRYDASSGNRFRRLKSLKDQVPDLDFIYVDVWYAKGSWDSRQLGREIHSLDLFYTTEFPQDHEYDAVWNHWAVDYKYGGKTIKGYNSKIVRFIRNHQKDTWIAKHPLLGGAEMVDYEGWQGRINYDACIDITFQVNVPTKYLQHFPIVKWDDNAIHFEDNVVVSTVSGDRVITKDGKEVLKNHSYLLPWNPKTEEKLYHWNKEGGNTTWELPDSWKNLSSVYLYRLTDQGKVFEKGLQTTQGSIAISAKANTPYAVYKSMQTEEQAMNWGEGTLVSDPGFNSGDLKFWKVEGKGASVERNSNGQYELSIEKGGATEVTQLIKRLPKGHYYASAYVSTKGRKAELGIRKGADNVYSYSENTLWGNYIAADSKHGSDMQRMYVHFDVKQYHEDVTLYLRAEGGDSEVKFDDIRLKPTEYATKPDSLYFQETFEYVPSGIYPFVKGPAGGANDPRVHLSELHSPYTQKGWNGKQIDDVIDGNWSLKLHEGATGLLIQTIPQNLRFRPGKKYTVSFEYQSASDGYSFVIGDMTEVITESKISPQSETRKYTVTFVASDSGHSWIGIVRNSKGESDLVIDNLEVVEH